MGTKFCPYLLSFDLILSKKKVRNLHKSIDFMIPKLTYIYLRTCMFRFAKCSIFNVNDHFPAQ